MVAEKPVIPAPPNGLNKAGVAAWRSIAGQFEFHTGELEILRHLCKTIDEISELEKVLTETGPLIVGSRGQRVLNPIYQQLTTHRTLLDRLMLSLALPADGEQVGRRRSPQAKQAAQSRWNSSTRRGRLPSVGA